MFNRREILRVGALSAFGLTVTDRLRAAPARPKACILLWLDGGPSHLDTFDPKPDAPAEVRGPFDSIASKLPGVRLGDSFPRTASLLGKIALIRSMTSPLGEHNLGSHYLLTGYRPSQALTYPSYGGVIAELRGAGQDLPPYVAVPDATPYAGAGFLPGSCRPFEVGGDPGLPEFRVKNLDPARGLTTDRLERRKSFRSALDKMGDRLEATTSDDPHLAQAYRLILSAKAKQAFDLTREPASVRASYGPRTLGQSCLLAKRLVEAGVPFVTVTDRGWDTHDRLVLRLKEGYTGGKVGKAAVLDQALAALLDDLDRRGLLATTLVIAMGEFGRTPRINTQGGRDHWPRVFSVLLAGGGVHGGQVIGKSDARGESPAERPVRPEDLARTVYDLLGVPPRHELTTGDGRPVRVRPEGKAIREVTTG
jgi:hypothetical protein